VSAVEYIRGDRAASYAPGIATTALLILAGVAAAVKPLLAVALVVVIVALLLVNDRARVPVVFLKGLGAILVGYAFFGRGFAYVGASPIYVGEVVLGLALLALPFVLRGARLGILQVLLLVFIAWGAVRTVPYVGTYGSAAARDGALWGYALFAVVLSATLRREHFPRIAELYGRMAPWLVRWILISLAAYFALGEALPNLPGTNVELINHKGGDLGVHLMIAGAFVLLGLHDTKRMRTRGEPLLWLTWVLAAVLILVVSRTSFLIFTAGLTISFLVRAPSRRRVQLVAAAAAVATLLIVANPSIPVGRGNFLSPLGFASNFTSIFSSSAGGALQAQGGQNLQGSKQFRLAWWRTIADYTLHGPYFWSGKGYGINLADADGFAIGNTHELRAPHNSTMNVLARSGVPGLVLWLMLQIGFVFALVTALLRARRAGALFWQRMDTWLLVAWAAMMIDTSFDPYLEGPPGGIWFWSVVGAGIAAIRIQRHDLERGDLDPREAAAA
jgi:hypothetical protein